MRRFFRIRLFRERPGDLPIEDVAAPMHPLENPVAVAWRRLTLFANTMTDRQKPLQAEIVREDGSVCERMSLDHGRAQG